MEFDITAGKKISEFSNGLQAMAFSCDPEDIDTAYDILCESVRLKDQNKDSQDLIDFENCADDDVETMLADLQRMDFLASWQENK